MSVTSSHVNLNSGHGACFRTVRVEIVGSRVLDAVEVEQEYRHRTAFYDRCDDSPKQIQHCCKIRACVVCHKHSVDSLMAGPRSSLTQPQLRSIASVPIDASAMTQIPFTFLESITTCAEPELPATCTAMWTYMVEPTSLSL